MIKRAEHYSHSAKKPHTDDRSNCPRRHRVSKACSPILLKASKDDHKNVVSYRMSLGYDNA